MSDERVLRPSPDVEAFHEQVSAAIAAPETCAPEEQDRRRRDLEWLRDTGEAALRRTRAGLLGLLDNPHLAVEARHEAARHALNRHREDCRSCAEGKPCGRARPLVDAERAASIACGHPPDAGR